VFAPHARHSSTRSGTLFLLAVASLATVHAATPYRQATVTRTQNQVKYGEVKGDRSELRPAAVDDVIRSSNFLQTETDSRAELKYDDGSLVRVGQNTVFSFEAITRTLSLGKGSMIFYVPKGSGGANVKTPSLTAAITGTIGKVASNYIAILEGSIVLKPSGKVVSAGQFARFEADGSITIDFYDPTKEMDGKLMGFNGPLPFLSERIFARTEVWKPDVSRFDTFDRTSGHPGARRLLDPVVAGPATRPEDSPDVPPPDSGGSDGGGGRY
jgi:FecR protein